MEDSDIKKVRRPRKKNIESTEGQKDFGNENENPRKIEETEIKPELNTEQPTDEPKPRKRKAKSKASDDDIKSIQTLLIGIHAGLAAILKEPEFNLTSNESETLGKALAEVQSQYNLVANPKIIAVVNLVAVSAFIYLPKLKKIKDNKKDIHITVHKNADITTNSQNTILLSKSQADQTTMEEALRMNATRNPN